MTSKCVLLGSEFRVSAILSFETSSLGVEGQLGKDLRSSKAQIWTFLDPSAASVSILYLASRFVQLSIIDPWP